MNRTTFKTRLTVDEKLDRLIKTKVNLVYPDSGGPEGTVTGFLLLEPDTKTYVVKDDPRSGVEGDTLVKFTVDTVDDITGNQITLKKLAH